MNISSGAVGTVTISQGGNDAAVFAALADGLDETEEWLAVAAGVLGWNGATLDRIRSEGNDRDGIAVETLGNLQNITFPHGFNSSSWDRLRSEGNDRDGISVLTLGLQMMTAFPHLFNGTTWDRQRGLGASSLEGLGQASVSLAVPGAGPIISFHTDSDPSTTRATIITPTSGKRIRIVTAIVSDVASGLAFGVELYFGTGANITSNPASTIFHSGIKAGVPDSYIVPFGDGSGPVGDVDEVVSYRHGGSAVSGIHVDIHFREE